MVTHEMGFVGYIFLIGFVGYDFLIEFAGYIYLFQSCFGTRVSRNIKTPKSGGTPLALQRGGLLMRRYIEARHPFEDKGVPPTHAQ